MTGRNDRKAGDMMAVLAIGMILGAALLSVAMIWPW